MWPAACQGCNLLFSPPCRVEKQVLRSIPHCNSRQCQRLVSAVGHIGGKMEGWNVTCKDDLQEKDLQM